MTEGLLQVAIDWKRVFASANQAIDAQNYERALELLREAEPLAEALGAEDVRLGETLERIGFVYHSQGRLDEAESQYRRALKIMEQRILGSVLTRKIRSQLTKLLEESGRPEEAKTFQDRALPKIYFDRDKSRLDQDSPAHRLMTTVKMLGRSGRGNANPAEVQSLMEGVLALIENTYGAESPEVGTALQAVADFIESAALTEALKRGERPQMTPNRTKASKYLRRALHISAKSYGKDSMNVVEVMRRLALFESNSELVKALQAKANAIEKGAGFENFSGRMAQRVVSKLGGQPPPPDIPLEEAEAILSVFYKSPLQDEAGPFVALELSQEQITRQILSLVEKAGALAEVSEANEPYPLQTIILLGQASKLHKDLGDIPRAKAIKERELAIIAKKWGEGHTLMVEALEEYNKL